MKKNWIVFKADGLQWNQWKTIENKLAKRKEMNVREQKSNIEVI